MGERQPGHMHPIIEKRLCFHQLLPPLSSDPYFWNLVSSQPEALSASVRSTFYQAVSLEVSSFFDFLKTYSSHGTLPTRIAPEWFTH